MERGFWTLSLVLGVVDKRSLDPRGSLFPQIGQHFNKDLFPSPSIFVLMLVFGGTQLNPTLVTILHQNYEVE